jgi:Tol biopolymer transport system component
MNPTEQIANLCVRVAIAAVCAVGVLGIGAAGALAAQETPEVSYVENYVSTPNIVSPSHEAFLHGVLDPAGGGEPGTYRFLYKESTSGECEGGETTTEGIAPTGEREEPSQLVAGLKPGTEYAVCLQTENAAKTKSTSAPVSFKTAIEPETPVTSEPVQGVTARTAVFEGVLNPNAAGEAGSYEFLYKNTANGAGCEGESVTPGAGAAGSEKEEARTEVSETTTGTVLEPNTTYTVCLLARNNAGETKLGNAVQFTTLTAKLAVESVSTPVLSADAATLEAVVNPENEPTTGCVFDYGETTGYGSEVACETASIGGFGGQPMTVKIAGLTRDTAYYYRVVVKNATGESEDTGKFVTNPAVAGPPQADCPNPGHTGLSDRLPDCRAYELVTPPDKQDSEDMFGTGDEQGGVGGTDSSEFGFPDEAPGEEGDKFFLTTAASFGANPDDGEGGYVFYRTPDGWRETSLDEPHGGGQTIFGNPVFSPDFSDALMAGKLGSYGNPSAEREFARFGPPGGPYTTLASSPLGTAVEAVGASSSFGRVFFQSREHLAGTAAVEQLPGSNALYEYSEGHYSLVNEKEGKTTSPCGAISPASEGYVGVYSHAVSSDGSRVFFLSPDPKNNKCYHETESGFEGVPPELYVREGGRTREVSVPETGVSDPEGPEPAAFAGASADGSRVFFITRGELTADDAGNIDPELYEYDTQTEKLTRVSSGDNHDAVGNVGWVVPSEDGSTVYFTATGNLAPGAPTLTPAPQYEGQATEEQNYNLYRYDTQTRTTTYIATVSGLDWYKLGIGGRVTLNIREPVQARADWQTTPDGGFLLFAAVEDLTGYDNQDPQYCEGGIGQPGGGNNNQGGCAEVYRYDAGTGSLICVSCNPGGALPYSSARFDGNTAYREVRGISNDGAYAFFNSGEALVPGATNGQQNVFEWHEGALSLISSGEDSSASYFLGTDASGNDVFFGTHARLVAQDTDTSGDLYDARVDGGFPVSRGSAACEGDACQSPPGPPVFGTPATLTLASSGNTAPQPGSSPTTAAKKTTKKANAGCTRTARRKCKGKAKAKHNRNARKARRTRDEGRAGR